MVSLNLTGFNFMSGQGFIDPGHSDLDLLTPNQWGSSMGNGQLRHQLWFSLA